MKAYYMPDERTQNLARSFEQAAKCYDVESGFPRFEGLSA